MASTLQQRRPGQAAKVVELPSDEDLVPFTPPSFTIKELLNAIPKRCFERSAFKSFQYLFMDFIMIACLGYAITAADAYISANLSGYAAQAARVVSWVSYWWFQGLVCTGVWVIAHECGHQAFSTSKTLNNAVGWVLHSALLVPYHSWRISHARHHAATGHMTRDEVFVPKTASQKGIKSVDSDKPVNQGWFDYLDGLFEDAPLWSALTLLGQQSLGWPMYLTQNVSGQAHYPENTNHFAPSSIIFDKRHFWQIVVSDIGLVFAAAAIYFAAQMTSLKTVIAYYGIPYMLVNHWLVCITFLQHTNPDLPHYRANEWNFARGALCTMDRHVYDFFTHDIASTHVAHHLSSKIPHYHAKEATNALKKVLGQHYAYTPENWLVSLWSCFRSCKYVDDEDEVVFFRNGKGQAKRKVVYDSSDSGVDVDN